MADTVSTTALSAAWRPACRSRHSAHINRHRRRGKARVGRTLWAGMGFFPWHCVGWKGEEIGKPDSVPRCNAPGPWSFLLAARCRAAPATEPGRQSGVTLARGRAPSYLVLLRVGFAQHPQSLGSLVSSYLTFSPLLRTIPGSLQRSLFCGTFPASRPAAVSGHPPPRSPDFPRT